MRPKISIVTISYNQGQFLEKSICSVLDQGYPNLEYIIIDGGSTDQSVEIIKRYEAHLTYWVSERDRGQSHALNKGFARCTGELMGWLNSDDYFLPGALESFAEASCKHPEAGAWVGDAQQVDAKGHVLKIQQPGLLDRDSLADWEVNGFQQPACLFSKKAWDAAAPIDENLYIAMDLDLWLKISRNFEFARIPLTLAAATIHPAAKTQACDNLKHVEMWMVLMRHQYEALAKRKMLEVLDQADILRLKVDRLTHSAVYPLIRPLVKTIIRNPQRPALAHGITP